MTNCNGETAGIVSAKNCRIPLLTLQASPFSLSQGDQIQAYIVAWNFYGSSENSGTGNGGTILRVPFAPVSVTNNLAVTSASVIGIIWSDGT